MKKFSMLLLIILSLALAMGCRSVPVDGGNGDEVVAKTTIPSNGRGQAWTEVWDKNGKKSDQPSRASQALRRLQRVGAERAADAGARYLQSVTGGFIKRKDVKEFFPRNSKRPANKLKKCKKYKNAKKAKKCKKLQKRSRGNIVITATYEIIAEPSPSYSY